VARTRSCRPHAIGNSGGTATMVEHCSAIPQGQSIWWNKQSRAISKLCMYLWGIYAYSTISGTDCPISHNAPPHWSSRNLWAPRSISRAWRSRRSNNKINKTKYRNIRAMYVGKWDRKSCYASKSPLILSVENHRRLVLIGCCGIIERSTKTVTCFSIRAAGRTELVQNQRCRLCKRVALLLYAALLSQCLPRWWIPNPPRSYCCQLCAFLLTPEKGISAPPHLRTAPNSITRLPQRVLNNHQTTPLWFSF
jgi:hypothetical protein